jgi:hypothetical protein
MAGRAHCAGCGGDVVAMRIGKSREDSEVVLRLERDVRGRVVPGTEAPVIDARADPLAHVPRNRVYWSEGENED